LTLRLHTGAVNPTWVGLESADLGRSSNQCPAG
jgi:hypothetical protein